MSKGMARAFRKCVTYGGGVVLIHSYRPSKSVQISINFSVDRRRPKKITLGQFISSIVYLLYLKQIYLHMQHSFITIYSLDSISHGGCNVLWSLGRQMVDIVTEYNSRQKCTLGWFSPAHFCTLLYLPNFCVLKITRVRYNLQDAIIYLGSRQWLNVY